jgi:hypothetical protein
MIRRTQPRKQTGEIGRDREKEGERAGQEEGRREGGLTSGSTCSEFTSGMMLLSALRHIVLSQYGISKALLPPSLPPSPSPSFPPSLPPSLPPSPCQVKMSAAHSARGEYEVF